MDARESVDYDCEYAVNFVRFGTFLESIQPQANNLGLNNESTAKFQIQRAL